MEKINWGVLGTANIARGQTIPGMKMADNCNLYAVAGRNPMKAETFREQFGFQKAYGSYEDLLTDPCVDAVYIPLPNMLHYEWTKKALEHGKHVLCEKPLTPTVREAEILFRAAEANNVFLMEAFPYLHSPFIAAMKNEIESGSIGEILYIESRFIISGFELTNIRMRKETNGGSMYDLGCYTTSMIQWMTGKEPDAVKASGIFSLEGIDLLTSAVFSYECGAKALMDCGMVLKTGARKRIDQLLIEGTAGSIYTTAPFNGCGDMMYLVNKNGKSEEKLISVPNNYCLEVEQLGRCIRNGEHPLVSKDFSISNLRTVERILTEIGY